MDDQVLKIAVPLVLGLVAAVAVISSLIWNVSGTWERVPDETTPRGAPPELLALGQLGPFVRGRRNVPGGWQEYSGFMVGRSVKLTRRDFGPDALKRNQFPEALAKKLSGDVFAEISVTLVERGTQLVGTFKPQKIDFLLAPPRVTSRHWLPPVPRAYRRVVLAPTEADAARRGSTPHIETA